MILFSSILSRYFYFLVLSGLCFFSLSSHANNIVINNISLTGQNTSAGPNHADNNALVEFNLSWDNSWLWNSTGGGLSYIGVKTGGSSYASAPTVTISGGGGSGATATASVSGGSVVGITITNAGSGYTSLPTVSFSGGGGSGATADAYIFSWWDAAWVFVKFRVGASNPTFTGVTSSGTTVTVTSTSNLRVGMPVRVTGGTGAFAANTVITSITNTTKFVVSATPTTLLNNASIECTRIWEHARLNNTGHTAPTGSVIDAGLLTPGTSFNATTNPALGAFIRRSSTGAGSNTFNNVQLRWNYAANGISDDAVVSVQVFGVEMVYTPQSSYFLGGAGPAGSFTNGSWTSGNAIPLQISSENTLTVAQSSGNLWGTSSSGTNTIGSPGSLSATFPKGYAAFYCMKYELSQGQYRDFYNTLTYAQQMNRSYGSSIPGDGAKPGVLSTTNLQRNGIDISSVGSQVTNTPAVSGCNLDGDGTYNESNDGEWIACNWLSWMDGCAYLDWSGLRPMTELEFEKACRGNQVSVSSEYAWGNATITQANNIVNAGMNNENTSTSGANAVYNNPTTTMGGPLRVGAFAGTSASRFQAGASYYGIMELSGNLAERIVNAGDVAGRSFTGLHGNGTLLRDGSADVNYWPGINGNSSTGSANGIFNGTTGITEAAGSGFRGGGWTSPSGFLPVSERGTAVSANTTRQNYNGFRGVRTAP